MNRSFTQLPQQKQLQIINAALEEFAQYGFDHASTNRIVQASEISKGSLFNYFGSKKKLYLSLAKYCIDVLMRDIPLPPKDSQIDFLRFLGEVTDKKIALYQKNPKLFAFIFSSIHEKCPQVQDDIMQLYTSNHEAFFVNIQEQIDTSFFKEGLNIEKAHQTIHHTLENVSRRYQEESNFDLEKSRQEIKAFLDFFREIFYR